jgi:predicted amidohydrolase YtcJ
MIHRLNVISLFLLFLLWFSSPAVRAQAPDLILHNGNIITLDDKLATASAVAIQGEKISTLGASEQVLKLAGPKTKIIDLKKRTVVRPA